VEAPRRCGEGADRDPSPQASACQRFGGGTDVISESEQCPLQRTAGGPVPSCQGAGAVGMVAEHALRVLLQLLSTTST